MIYVASTSEHKIIFVNVTNTWKVSQTLTIDIFRLFHGVEI